MSRPYRYPWPASRVGRTEIALLYAARECSPERKPITVLIAQAIQAQFGHLVNQPDDAGQAERETPLRPAA